MDLAGYEHDIVVAANHARTGPRQIELLNIVRDGGFSDGCHLSKFDPKVPKFCVTCGELDTAEHRLRPCQYAAVRLPFESLVRHWPSAAALRCDAWRALDKLHETA